MRSHRSDYRELLRPGYVFLHGGTAGTVAFVFVPLWAVAVALQLGGGGTFADIFMAVVFIGGGVTYVVALLYAVRDIDRARASKTNATESPLREANRRG